MPTTRVDLGNIIVCRKQTHAFFLSLISSCTIDLPPTWTGSPNASEIAKAVKEGTLWITKAGSCQLDFSVLVNGQPPSKGDIDEPNMLRILDLIAECPVWQKIGLQLKDKHLANQDRSMASFLLHHQHLSSTINTPLPIPRGEFQGMKCQVNITYTNASTQASTQVANSNRERTGTWRYNLQNLNSRATGSGGEQDGGLTDPPISDVRIDADETGQLLDAALRKLIGVGKRLAPGFKTVKKSSAPSLIGVAPAVWNLNYLESMTSHAEDIAVLATGLARLRITGSSSLRKKLDLLACREKVDDIDYTDHDRQDDIKAEITKRMWLLCQTKIEAKPVLEGGSVQKESMSQFTPDEHMVNDASLPESQSTQVTLVS